MWQIDRRLARQAGGHDSPHLPLCNAVGRAEREEEKERRRHKEKDSWIGFNGAVERSGMAAQL